MDKTAQDIRRDNIRALVSEYGTQRALAEAAGLVPAYVSQLINGYREMGETVARRIEAELKLSKGWMDTPHVPGINDNHGAYGRDADTLTPEEAALLDIYRQLPAEERVRLRAVIDALTDAGSKLRKKGASESQGDQ